MMPTLRSSLKSKVSSPPRTAVVYDKDRNASVEVPTQSKKASQGRHQGGISNGTKTEILAPQTGDTVILQQ